MSLASKLIGCVGIAAFLTWGAAQLGAALRVSWWRAEVSELGRGIVASDMIPPFIPEAYLTLAKSFNENQIPADNLAAEDRVAKVLPLEPMSATLWIPLGKYALLQGKEDVARAALGRAADLSPLVPREQLEAIPLWVLLGEEVKAGEIAQRIASAAKSNYSPDGEEISSSPMGSGDERPAVQAARALSMAGFAPDVAFRLLDGEHLEPSIQVAVLTELRTSDAAVLQRIFDQLSPKTIANPAFHDQLLRVASDPFLEGVAMRIWSARSGNLLHNANGVPVDNLDLARNPFADSFSFGWQSPRSSAGDAYVEWSGPAEGGSRGSISIEFDDRYTDGKAFTWPLYVFVAPAGKAVRAELILSITGDLGTAASFQLSAKGTAGRSEQVVASGEDQTLTATLPAADKPRIVRVILNRKPPTKQRTSTPGSVVIKGLDIRGE